LAGDAIGANSYAGKPAGEGLALFLELGVELDGEIDGQTGLIINVSDIDKVVRQAAVPLFAQNIREHFCKAHHISCRELAKWMSAAWRRICGRFGSAKLTRLILKLSPFRRISIEEKEADVVYYSEKFEFAATHKLWNEQFSEQQNVAVFGKCANPAGHGHNYIVEVTVRMAGAADTATAEFERIVDEQLMHAVDHKNLNTDVPEFAVTRPTVENIAVFAWNRLVGKFGRAGLHCITVWETDRTYCSYYGS
jgi:6-pyruvoyltetrahydropterin/6-carboxytetrahydropterin synthase